MDLNGQNYSDWLQKMGAEGGEFAWMWRNSARGVHDAGRGPGHIEQAVLTSSRVQEAIARIVVQKGRSEEAVRLEANKILSNMAHDLHFHSAVQPIGYTLAKIFRRIFTRIWVNFGQLERIGELAKDKAVPIVWLPTHKSYLDFLLLSLLSYHSAIQLPAICAAEDFRSSKLLGEALRRCGAFFIRRSFKGDALYWAIFGEYVQQHLLGNDRPIEFFLEGQRSRTGKSVYPRSGLLQLVLEPFLRAQIYDVLLVPVTINYERILEEKLFAMELLGFTKPKETTSGLLKAGQVLSQSFGEIYVTVGQPISARDYFQGQRDIRLELVRSRSEVENVANEKAQKLALEIVERQNEANLLPVWPFLALVLLQMDELDGTSVPLASLGRRVHKFVVIYEKCFPTRKIRRICPEIEGEIRHCLQMHGEQLQFDEAANSIGLRGQSSGENHNFPGSIPNLLLLSNYTSLAISELAPISIYAICASRRIIGEGNRANLSPFDSFNFVRTLLDQEFIFEPTKMRTEFDGQRELFASLENSEKEYLCRAIRPYLTGYWLVLGTFLDLSSRDFSHVELINTSNRELQAKSTGRDYSYKWPALVFSLNLVKNAFNSMKKQKLMQFDGSRRVQMDCAGIRRIWERLGEYDRNGPVQGLIKGGGKSKL